MRKKGLVYLGILAAIVVTIMGWNSFSDKKPEFSLRLGYGQSIASPRHLAAEKFAKWTYEQTKGRVKIELFPEEALGTDKQMTEMAVMGTLDMVITAPGVIASYEPKIAVLELPFLFESLADAANVLDGPMGEELAQNLPQKGIRLLAYWDNGFRQITTNKRPIRLPEELKGLKIRVPENKMSLSIFRAMGANPIPLPFPEVYIALARNEIDGQENPSINIYTSQLYKVQKYLAVTNHKYESTPLIISEKAWQKLPEDIRTVLKAGAIQFAIEQRKMNQAQDSQIIAALEERGMQISHPDLLPFRKATQPVYDEWAKLWGQDLVDRVRNGIVTK